jgi:DNA-binding NarL/FixJ family response regulator
VSGGPYSGEDVPAAEVIRVALADDHTLFRRGVRELLSTDTGFAVVGEAASGEQAVALCSEHWPDVLLLDVEMPGPGAGAVIRQVRRSSPRTRVVVLTMHDDAAVMREVFDSGAAAFLTKTVLLDDLVAAARSVCRDAQTVTLSVSRQTLRHFGGTGGPDIPVQVARSARPYGTPGCGAAPGPVLTARERQVIRLVADGLNNTQIARRLCVTHATVKRHLTNAYAKLDATSRADAVRRATAARIIATFPRPR